MKIRVECYAGYRGEEEPRAFKLGERRFAVLEILDRWRRGAGAAECARAGAARARGRKKEAHDPEAPPRKSLAALLLGQFGKKAPERARPDA